jgi:hypothetical protein
VITICRYMNWGYDQLLAAPAALVARIAHHVRAQAQQPGAGAETGIEL